MDTSGYARYPGSFAKGTTQEQKNAQNLLSAFRWYASQYRDSRSTSLRNEVSVRSHSVMTAGSMTISPARCDAASGRRYCWLITASRSLMMKPGTGLA